MPLLLSLILAEVLENMDSIGGMVSDFHGEISERHGGNKPDAI